VWVVESSRVVYAGGGEIPSSTPMRMYVESLVTEVQAYRSGYSLNTTRFM
jgi:hypothetical protein